MTPTRARPCVTREPTESDRVVVQMPSLPVRSQRPMIVNGHGERQRRLAEPYRPENRGGRPSRCAAMPSSTSRLHSRSWRSASESARASAKPIA
jgi:hypothetical protein